MYYYPPPPLAPIQYIPMVPGSPMIPAYFAQPDVKYQPMPQVCKPS